MSPQFRAVPSYDDIDETRFATILENNKPAVLRGCNFGQCMTKWTIDYLAQKLQDIEITIHESSSANLEFIEKNFQYRACKFGKFAEQLRDKNPDSYIYLRSTNKNPRAKRPARIEDDFPAIAEDLCPPSFIPYGADNDLYHSSVLRVASTNVQIWTHFDLYDNVLCQVVGTKRIVLLPPEDIRYLYVKGDKSPVNEFDNMDICSSRYPLIENASPHLCLLEPGDVLFIPALWWHNIRTVSEDQGPSVGFNIFWRDRELALRSMYAERDVYGNKDLVPFESALTNLDKAISHLERLPDKYKDFYKCMLLERMKGKLNSMK